MKKSITFLTIKKTAGQVRRLQNEKPVPLFLWQVKNKEGEEQAPTISEMVRYFFNANCRICCYQQHIQVYFDTTVQRYSSIFETFWTNTWDFNLWYWDSYPVTA